MLHFHERGNTAAVLSIVKPWELVVCLIYTNKA